MRGDQRTFFLTTSTNLFLVWRNGRAKRNMKKLFWRRETAIREDSFLALAVHSKTLVGPEWQGGGGRKTFQTPCFQTGFFSPLRLPPKFANVCFQSICQPAPPELFGKVGKESFWQPEKDFFSLSPPHSCLFQLSPAPSLLLSPLDWKRKGNPAPLRFHLNFLKCQRELII